MPGCRPPVKAAPIFKKPSDPSLTSSGLVKHSNRSETRSPKVSSNYHHRFQRTDIQATSSSPKKTGLDGISLDVAAAKRVVGFHTAQRGNY